MHISKIRVQNYKAFYDSESIEFKPGINIISGQNNSGKTALLEVLNLNFQNIPHKSLKTLPERSSTLKEKSKVDIAIKITKDEFQSLINQFGNRLLLPLPETFNQAPLQLHELGRKLEEIIYQLSNLEFIIPLDSKDIDDQQIKLNTHNTIYSNYLSFNAYKSARYQLDSKSGVISMLEFHYDNLQDKITSSRTINATHEILTNIKIPRKLISELKNKSYRFYAERMNLSKYSFGSQSELKPDASNLAEVINCLQSQPNKFKKFNDLVSIVLPFIKKITIEPRRNNKVEIMVWSIDPDMEYPNKDRNDLAFTLSACGTGVGQILAILYVVVTSTEPRTIIIDEPQSFLHPGAAKKLIEILQDFPQHQYFISTHSPSIISAANPSTITLLRYENSEAIPLPISSNDTEEMRFLLDEVGVHLSDVFGSDNILWVEGPTEERCFSLILKEIAKLHLRGTQILAIKNTGDLEGKRSHIIFDIYDKLSGGKFLLPPAIGFILDKENKTEKQMEDLKKRSENEVKFIKKRMYENYLLVPEAIAEIANEQEGFRDKPLEALEVKSWIEEHKSNYLPKNFKEDDNWRDKVDGAKLLNALFKELSENRVTYKKTQHSVELTEWLVKHKPEQLLDLAKLLTDILASNK